jgi:hypothetical protein
LVDRLSRIKFLSWSTDLSRIRFLPKGVDLVINESCEVT